MTEAINDPTLPDLPRGYQIVRHTSGVFAGRLEMRPSSGRVWTLVRDTPHDRLIMVLCAWDAYADLRNAK